MNEVAMNSHPLLDIDFVYPLIKYFADKNVHLAMLDNEGEKYGCALLERVAFKRWKTFQPSQAPLGLIMLRQQDMRFGDPLHGLMTALPAHPYQLTLLHQDPAFNRLPQLIAGARIEKIRYGTTIKVTTTNGFESYWKVRSKNLRKNIARYMRRLAEDNIETRFTVQTEMNQMDKAVSTYGELETLGWKGKGGTAIRADTIQGAFYNDVLKSFARRGLARVYQLYFDDKLASSRLTIQNKNMLVILKTTYDESLRRYAPGRILLHLLLKDVFEKEYADSVEFYTKANVDQLSWSDERRDIYHLNYYSSAQLKRFVQLIRKVRAR